MLNFCINLQNNSYIVKVLVEIVESHREEPKFFVIVLNKIYLDLSFFL